jgi:hypothetical protein
VSENGSVNWEVAVAGTTAQEAIEKVETLLAQLESNPTQLLLLWQPGEVTNPTLYEIRGAGHWEPNFENATLEGANLFMIALEIPVGPLAQGLPGVVYEKSGLSLPETISLSAIPGDAPALAEVSIETGEEPTLSFITGTTKPTGLAVNTEYVYFAQPSTGYIGRCKISEPTKPELTWLHTEGEPYGVTVDSSHIYWSDNLNGYIGRAALAGGSVEKTWITASKAGPLVVNSEYVFWAPTNGTIIHRCKLTEPTKPEAWVPVTSANFVAGLAIDGAFIYFSETETGAVSQLTISTKAFVLLPGGVSGAVGLALSTTALFWARPAGNAIGRSGLGGEGPVASWVATSGEPFAVAFEGEYVYFADRASGVIGRAKAKENAAPIWGLFGWAVKPSTGLAVAPFGVLDSATSVAVTGWSEQTLEGARGGKAMVVSSGASIGKGAAYWEVDPATMTPDSFSGEIAVEVLARVALPIVEPTTFVLSAQPQDGTGYGAARYTDEWGSAGRTVPKGEAAATSFRMTRLGTLHLLVNPLAPRIWKLWLEGTTGELHGGEWMGVDYLVLVPSLQRACSPTSKAQNSSYPSFIANVAPTVKTVRSNLSAVVAKPGKNGHPDHGLGGQLMQLPPGETCMLLKLSSQVPDAPEVLSANEQLEHTAKVIVTVTPRWFLARTV